MDRLEIRLWQPNLALVMVSLPELQRLRPVFGHLMSWAGLPLRAWRRAKLLTRDWQYLDLRLWSRGYFPLETERAFSISLFQRYVSMRFETSNSRPVELDLPLVLALAAGPCFSQSSSSLL